MMANWAKVNEWRKSYPALTFIPSGVSHPEIFLDGPGGTQVSQSVINAYQDSLIQANANRHAPFRASILNEKWITDAQQALAAFLGASDPSEIIIGSNMTTLAFHLAESVADSLNPTDTIVISGIDHDANIAPWVHAAKRSGATVSEWPMNRETYGLDLEALSTLIQKNTKWLAFTAASNATGTRTDVATICKTARALGSPNLKIFVDAVHLTPHALPDVSKWGADFVAISPYKFFGPHSGALWAKKETIELLKPRKVRPSPTTVPEAWMTGTQNHEAIHAIAAGIHHLATLGETPKELTLRQLLESSYEEISKHETELTQRFLTGLKSINGFRLHGDPTWGPGRVSTFALETLRGTPRDWAESLGRKGIRSYAGNFYALSVTKGLGLEQKGGLLRLGFVHYNTIEEVDQTLQALADKCSV